MFSTNKPLLALTMLAIALAFGASCQTSSATPVPALSKLPASNLHPGPNDPRIADVAARLLEEYHYSQQPLDEKMSERFFTNYINSLDPRHENFLQSDLAGFDHYRTNLDKLTVGGSRAVSDVSPAFTIYDRYTKRIQQHDLYAIALLKQDKFKFTGDDKITLDRENAAFPTNLDDAKHLWKQELRYEFLREKLDREIHQTNGEFVVKLPHNADKDIAKTLLRHYRWILHSATNQDSDNILQLYLNALCHAYDPHSDYFSAPKAQDFSIGMNLSLFGIGAQLYEDDGYCTIRSLVPGGPAAKSKAIHEKDRIVAVAQGDKKPVNVVDMELEKVVQLIRGPKGTVVKLTISPATDRSEHKVVKLVRDEIKLEDSEAKARLVVYPDGRRIGIIDLPSFYATVNLDTDGNPTPKSTTADVAKLLKRLEKEKVSGIIIDLRTNPGGSLEEAIKFTGLFIKSGPVVQARFPDGRVQVDADTDPQELYKGPLMVLVNRFSASAAEIAAAALQDYGRAVIVGDKSTHGKGTVQTLYPLRPFVWPATKTATNDPGTIKITIRKFYRITGASTQLKGVTPNIVLPDVLNYSKDIGESSLKYPLPWDTIKPVPFHKLNLVTPYIARLKKESEERVATNQDFIYIRQDIKRFKKLQADKTFTLNEKQALKEREDNAERAKAREKERASRKPSGVKVYEITVENANKPGLTEVGASAQTNAVASTATSNSQSNNVVNINNKATGTNALTSGTGTSGQTNKVNTAKAAKKSAPEVDPMLHETENILLNYISLLAKNGVLMANQ